MTKYLHHVPGRLRMRAPIFRLDSPQRGALLRGLRTRDGVTGVELNARAASVTVYYDPVDADADQILAWLEERTAAVRTGPATTRRREPRPAADEAASRNATPRGLGAEIGRMALSVLVNRGVSYSLSSLLGPRL